MFQLKTMAAQMIFFFFCIVPHFKTADFLRLAKITGFKNVLNFKHPTMVKQGDN